jgi:hypothetical protein
VPNWRSDEDSMALRDGNNITNDLAIEGQRPVLLTRVYTD